jgi:transcriptional regulator with XRE-family HTH domain
MASYSQQRLADKTGVSQSVISRFERGLAPGMSSERLIAICDVLGRAMPMGFCPHSEEHSCRWPPILPVGYEHPPVPPRKIGLPVIDKPKRHRLGTEIMVRLGRELRNRRADDAEDVNETIVRIAAEVTAERAAEPHVKVPRPRYVPNRLDK